jgi:hypothetical protein
MQDGASQKKLWHLPDNPENRFSTHPAHKYDTASKNYTPYKFYTMARLLEDTVQHNKSLRRSLKIILVFIEKSQSKK